MGLAIIVDGQSVKVIMTDSLKNLNDIMFMLIPVVGDQVSCLFCHHFKNNDQIETSLCSPTLNQ